MPGLTFDYVGQGFSPAERQPEMIERAAGRRSFFNVPFTQDQLVIFAARSGNLDLLATRVAGGGDINTNDRVHGSPLVAAIVAGHLATVEWLCSHGANVNAVLADGVGPLEVALKYSDTEVVYALVSAGARLRRKTRPFYAERLAQCLMASKANGPKTRKREDQRQETKD